MARKSRKDWIEEGFRVLASEGDAGLTVDALCERLGRTKGSFYHHFEGRPGYVEDLLAAWERQATDRIIASGSSAAPVKERLRAVNRQASELRNARLERAIRGWAAREPQARRVQDRVDQKRHEFLVELCTERMRDPEAARVMAKIVQLALVGAQHLDPPLEGDDLYETLRFLDPLFDIEGGGLGGSTASQESPRGGRNGE
jgi:AcrR family transcriptional regulator